MTGMEEVLTRHVAIEDVDEEFGSQAGELICNWSPCRMAPIPIDEDGHYLETFAAHVAQALAEAGFGSQHDAWAEGYDVGWSEAEDPVFVSNPYPKVSE